ANRCSLVVCLSLWASEPLRANGGAWQTGVPLTGNGSASDKDRSTEIALEEENLTIDLHQEFAEIEVRYRMRNTGGKVLQDFFFPVERWSAFEGEADVDGVKPADLEGYRITADKTELKVKTIDLAKPKKREPEQEAEAEAPAPEPAATDTPNEQSTETANDAEESDSPDDTAMMEDFPPAAKQWKKSEIPFAANQTREIVIRYRVGYSGYERSVSDDSHASEQLLVYSLSPAATWKGVIGRGKIVVNVLHPLPEEVAIGTPADRFKKVDERRYEWEFTDLEPTLADDLKIVSRRAYDSYSATRFGLTEAEQSIPRDYLIEGDRYFLLHGDYTAVASSTLPKNGERQYGVANLPSYSTDLPWCEGVEGDGVGESITFEVKNPLPLASIQIMPGYHSNEKPALWEKNNRVAELEVTLNDEHTFTAKIPDEHFSDPYPIPVRGYATPVKRVKLVIKAVHRGTGARDTCISSVRFKAKLAQKPKFQPAR
ncbi:MAG: hypothetical protein ABI883_07205, partial [Chthoniobacterales bacterium]